LRKRKTSAGYAWVPIKTEIMVLMSTNFSRGFPLLSPISFSRRSMASQLSKLTGRMPRARNNFSTLAKPSPPRPCWLLPDVQSTSMPCDQCYDFLTLFDEKLSISTRVICEENNYHNQGCQTFHSTKYQNWKKITR
jgi:hypothetical protein